MAEQRIDNYREATLDELKQNTGVFLESSNEFSQNIKNASFVFNRALDSMNKSLTFASKEMQKTFKQYSSIDGQKQKFMLEFYEQQAKSAESVKKLRAEAAEKSGKTQEANALKELANLNEAHLKQMSNLDAEAAYRKVKQQEVKNYTNKLLTGLVNDVVGYFQKTLGSAWDTLNSAYANNYKTITSLGAYNKAEYNEVLNYFDDFIRNAGLTSTVNRTDFEEVISQVLKGGLGGNIELAKLVTKYSVLASEGGISADFTDQSFLMTIKNMSDAGQDVEAFLQLVTTQSKAVINEVGDSFGFANGQVNTMISSLYELQSVTNMTDAALQSSATSMTALNGVLGSTGIDTNKLYQNIIDYSNNGLIGASAESLLAFSGMNSSQMKNLLESQGMGAALDLMMKNIYDRYKTSGATGELTSALSSALGSDLTTADINKLFKKYSTYEEFSSAFSGAMSAAGSANLDTYMASLKNFQTNQEKLDNQAVNALSDINQAAHENLATEWTLNKILSAITTGSIINAVSSVLDFDRTLNQASGESIFNLTGGRDLNSGKRTLTTSGKLIGSASLAGGLIARGLVGFDAYNTAQESGSSTGRSMLAGLIGAGLGYSDYGATNAQKMESVKEKGLIDWSQVRSSAGSGAAIGAGIGTFAGGHALLGGAIGGTAGAISNLVTQAIDKHNYEQYLKSDVGSLGDSLQKTSEDVSKLSNTFSEYQSLLGKNTELEKLKLTQTGEERKLTELQIEANKTLINQKYAELGATKDLIEQFERNSKTITSGRAVMSAMASVSGKMSSAGITSDTNITNLSSTDINALISDEELEAFRKNNFIKSTGNDFYDKIGILQTLSGSKEGKNWFSKIETDSFSMATAKGGVSSSFYTNLSADISTAEASNAADVSAALSLISAYNSEDPSTYRFLQKGLAILLNNAKIQYGSDLNNLISGQSIGSVIGLLSENNSYAGLDCSAYQNWLKTNGTASDEFKGYYRTGLAYVPYDNFPAVLHKGERVLNASDAANYSDKSNMNSNLSNALVSQVDTIVTILNNIYDYMRTGFTSSSQSQVFNQPVNYNLPAGV